MAADLPVKARPSRRRRRRLGTSRSARRSPATIVFRGITQSNREPSASAYFEPRYNFNPDWQLYAGMAGASISFPNRAAAEIDFYAGIRPTFGKLALDLGALYYWYPGGQCFHVNPAIRLRLRRRTVRCLLNGNVIKRDLSFLEGYVRGVYSVTDAFQLGFNVVLHRQLPELRRRRHLRVRHHQVHLPGVRATASRVYISGEGGYQWLGTSDDFYGLTGLLGGPGINYADYATWNVGIGFTYKVLTLDLRYIDTNLSKGELQRLHQRSHARPSTARSRRSIRAASAPKWCGATLRRQAVGRPDAQANIK